MLFTLLRFLPVCGNTSQVEYTRDRIDSLADCLYNVPIFKKKLCYYTEIPCRKCMLFTLLRFLPVCGNTSQVEYTRDRHRICTENKLVKRDTDR